MPVFPSILRRFQIADDPAEGKGPRGRVLKAIQDSGFSVEYIQEDQRNLSPEILRRGDSFGLFLRPGRDAKSLWGLDREVLLWCSTFPTFQAKDIDAMRRVIESSGARLSRQFAILVTAYDPSSRSEFEFEAEQDVTMVHISLSELSSRGLRSLLSERMFSRDLFDVAGATVRPADFFGRRELIDRLVGEIEAGTSQTGIFGLRKVGKTSVLNRLSDRLRNSGKCAVARLDLQWTVSINPRAEYTLWALGESIYASHRSIRLITGFRIFGQFSSFSDIENSEEVVWEWFAHDIGRIVEVSKKKLCILIDEIERMYERPKERGFVRFWRLLRGLDQQHRGILRYIVGGTSPQCAESGSVADEDNPLFRYLNLEYLGPLLDGDAKRLLEGLGRPMGLQFQPAAMEWALKQCGGHPALLRTLGSTVHTANKERHEPIQITSHDLNDLSQEVSQRSSAVLDQMISALEDQYPDEFYLLHLLAEGRIFQFREYSEIFPSEVRHLQDYGLILTKVTPSIRLQLLHSHLVTRATAGRLNMSAGSVLDNGASIGSWEVLSCVAAGAYGDVYKVQALEYTAAAKIIRTGQLSALQREVDILKELKHPNIVRIIDALRSDEGLPCMIMEYLEGHNLAYYCTPTHAPSTRDWLLWLDQILQALDFMHPHDEMVRIYEGRETLTSADFAAWDLARHGYVHRDIKPENIVLVPARGPVLIDFNIAVRSGAPVLTLSSTPGYMPIAPQVWQPYIDLYGLGVTFAELAAGARLATSSLGELLEIGRSRHGEMVVNVVNTLLGAIDSGISAGTARKNFLAASRQ